MTKEQEQMFVDSLKVIAKRDAELASRMHQHYIVAKKEADELRKQWLEKLLAKRR